MMTKKEFVEKYTKLYKDETVDTLAVTIQMPDDYPKPEVILIAAANQDKKIGYYIKTYDDNMRHKHNPRIQIIKIDSIEVKKDFF